MDHGTHQQTGSVGHDMALTAVDFLGRIIASGSAAFGGLDRLAVDDASRGTGFAANRLARLQQEFKIDPLEQVLVPPIAEIALHRGERRKVLRQQAHWQPVRAIYKIASTTARRSVSRGRPKRLTAGI
jgi:hypothetical protein